MSQQDGKTEGWLYLIRSNRFGLQYSRRRYFILEADTLSCFKSMPVSGNENPRTAMIDSCIRVTDNGRESIKRNVFFIFTLYNSSNHNDQLKLGARSSEEAASWIRSLMEAALKGQQSSAENGVSFSKPRWQPFRFSHKRRSQTDSVDWTLFPPINSDPVTSDVIAPSPWTIFGCQNGLRLFKEAKDGDVNMKRWSDHPAIMAVGVVAATSEAIFRTIMSLGPSRSEWDFCFYKGEVIEHLDGHTDIIHKKLKLDWLPWGMRPRDLLLQRYWRREDDGTYVILYHSVFHESCRSENGYVRACLKSGGYVITPVNQGRQSVVKHMLAIDWKSWKSFLFPSSAKCVTVRMLGRVAALRELFKANRGNLSCPDSSSGELMREISVHIDKEPTMENGVQSVEEATKSEDSKEEPGTAKTMNSSGSFVELNDAGDEFFDVPEQSDIGYLETEWPSHACVSSQDGRQTKLSSAAGFVKMLQFATQKRGYIDLQELPVGDTTPCIYGATLPKDGTCNMLCSCTTAEPSTFLIRGETYLQDRHKIKANGTLMQMVGADWLKSDKREDDLAGRHSSIVQKYTSQGGKEFFFIINIQVPGSTTYSLAFYYMMDVPLQNVPLFERFVNGDDAFRNSRFKLIPYISKGSWIVKQSVGKKACLVGQALEIHYFRGKNYLELGIDIGSSTVARGVVSLVLGYLNNLVIEMAFVIQGNSDEELPEFLLGTCRLNHLDATKAVPVH